MYTTTQNVNTINVHYGCSLKIPQVLDRANRYVQYNERLMVNSERIECIVIIA